LGGQLQQKDFGYLFYGWFFHCFEFINPNPIYRNEFDENVSFVFSAFAYFFAKNNSERICLEKHGIVD
jgi:hypothetical protein